jgi:hypothetical protein
MICSSNVFFINNPDPNPDPKLRLKPDPDPKKLFKKTFGYGALTCDGYMWQEHWTRKQNTDMVHKHRTPTRDMAWTRDMGHGHGTRDRDMGHGDGFTYM